MVEYGRSFPFDRFYLLGLGHIMGGSCACEGVDVRGLVDVLLL